jgi:hypothetical protein
MDVLHHDRLQLVNQLQSQLMELHMMRDVMELRQEMLLPEFQEEQHLTLMLGLTDQQAVLPHN